MQNPKSDEITVEISDEPNFDIETPQHKPKRAILRKSPDSDKSSTINYEDDRGWTEKSNGLVLLWLRRCSRLMSSHNEKITRCRRINNTLTILYIVLNAISSSLALLGVGGEYLPSGYSRAINIFIAFSNLFTAVLAGINAYLEMPKNIEKLKYALAKFSKLIRSLEIVVFADIEDRPLAKKFLEDISEKFHKYQTAGDMVGEFIEEIKGKKKIWKLQLAAAESERDDRQLHDDDSPYIKEMKEIIEKPSRNSSASGVQFPKSSDTAHQTVKVEIQK